MATKSDSPGLLSKMAMFVRNPTKDWSELERPQADEDSSFDKQVLKQMIERKRQNDFIRKREFDQLRKLRSRGVSAVVGMGRPSVFQNSLATDPDGRAVTLKKIDEIEAQMSKQWWKGKQDAANAQGGGAPVVGASGMEPTAPMPVHVASNKTISEQFDSSISSLVNLPDVGGSGADFKATEMGDGMEPLPPISQTNPKPPPGVGRIPILGTVAQRYDSFDQSFSTSSNFAANADDMATDPELEEAAIRFANGDDEGAESGLLAALRSDAVMPEVAHSWAAALLDFYRATNDRTRFDQAVAEFGYRFETMIPQWSVIGGETTDDESLDTQDLAPARPNRDFSVGAIWSSPAELNALALEDLRDAMASNPTPWHLDWSRLSRISEDAMPLLSGLFGSLCDEPVALRFSGAQHLVATMRAMMPSGDSNINPDWWSMRLNAMRTMQLLDDFELAALDYCVTYEVSPPAWQEARCLYSNVEAEESASTSTPTQPSAWNSGYAAAPTVPVGLDGARAASLKLMGNVLGDATHAFDGFDATEHRGEGIVVSCKGLIRVDFSAAGSILNWVAMREADGYRVQFRDVHRLVAAFFNVIGINEHARVVPRPV